MIDICVGLGIPVKSNHDEDFVELKASTSNPSLHCNTSQVSTQINTDTSLRNRSTLMGFGAVYLSPSSPAFCIAEDKDAETRMGSVVARLTSCEHVRANLDLFQTASSDWEDRADPEIESTDRARSDPHFVDIGLPNNSAIEESPQMHDKLKRLQHPGSSPVLKARDVIAVLRDLLYHANAEDWFEYPEP